jgi:hypothetical protein
MKQSGQARSSVSLAELSNDHDVVENGVRRHPGFHQCQVHKRRSVLEQLPEEYQPGFERKLLAAYGMLEYTDAKRVLEQIHRELDRINPSAARSLEEGMEETLTVHKL